MARAKRHFIPGYIWHITHRCHKRKFLLKFSKNRHRYLQWLYQAKKRYGLSILNYMVTSNHVHLLVIDKGKRDVIPKSMQLVAGRTGQEYNQRKNRKGAYWEDRYHATALESGEHLSRCMVYIDTNMVRAGVVSHPSMWSFSGYNEIQEPRRKNILIDYERLQGLFGGGTYYELKSSHRGWVEEYLGDGKKGRQGEWTDSIAVGSKAFIEKVKSLLGFNAKSETAQINTPQVEIGSNDLTGIWIVRWTDPYAYYLVKWQIIPREERKWKIISTLLETSHSYNRRNICKTKPNGSIEMIGPNQYFYYRESSSSDPGNKVFFNK